MKLKIGLLGGLLLLAGANAMACYTVYDGNSRVVYRGLEAPVDMSLPLHEALASRFRSGVSMVFEQTTQCTAVGIAQVPRPTGTMVPVNTIRMEGSGRQASPSPSSAAPLFTDLRTAERERLPHTVVAGDIAMVPASVAGRMDLPNFTVIPAEVAVARAATPNTTVLGAGAHPSTVITEMHNPPVTVIEQGGNTRVQRY